MKLKSNNPFLWTFIKKVTHKVGQSDAAERVTMTMSEENTSEIIKTE